MSPDDGHAGMMVRRADHRHPRGYTLHAGALLSALHPQARWLEAWVIIEASHENTDE
jgi:hypothetical protein